MAAFDRIRLSRFKKMPTLSILKQIKFAKQKGKGNVEFEKSILIVHRRKSNNYW